MGFLKIPRFFEAHTPMVAPVIINDMVSTIYKPLNLLKCEVFDAVAFIFVCCDCCGLE